MSSVVSARRPLLLTKKNGSRVELLMAPLSDVDISELDEWIRAQFIRTARESLPPTANQTERDETLRVAMQVAMTLSAFSGTGARSMATVDGMSRLVWQATRQHSQVTLEEIRAFLFDPRNMAEANAVFQETNVPDYAQKKETDAGKKTGNPHKRQPPRRKKR